MVLDFEKAFKKVPHALLMQKLKLIPDMHPAAGELGSRFFDELKADSGH